MIHNTNHYLCVHVFSKTFHFHKFPLDSTVNSRPADTPLLRTLAITDKIQIPGE